ncbi:hypothetical protein FNF31_00445 [Cafeteria roenbergensis]|uniref:EF-hand domain-containing protein n=1 Tax=Cafeteria roenbergensis TaxID=33653 RepID=A0A5A8DSW8_CAFRO|nr:hypothetical protein FNF31_00445 [Cafeteria roenbergensis]KAA0171152.1 hypothetical protein FNF28_00919 [Cafeteria roenbergensis]
MGNKPLKPVLDPADLPHLTDAETLQRISVRFRQLSEPGPKGPHVTPGSFMEHCPKFVDKYGPTIVARVIDMMDTEGTKTASRVGFVTAAYALSCGTSTLRARQLFNLFNASHKPKLALEDFAAVYTPLAAAQHRGSSAAAAPDRELREAMDELGAISARAVFEARESDRSGRMSEATFSLLVEEDHILQQLRAELSQLLVPSLLG